MHEKSALESYWTVNPLSLFFFFSWLIYCCLSHLLTKSERTEKRELDQKGPCL